MDAVAVPAAWVVAAAISHAIYEYEVSVYAISGALDGAEALAAVAGRAWVEAVIPLAVVRVRPVPWTNSQ
jgi:hypothetical protein